MLTRGEKNVWMMKLMRYSITFQHPFAQVRQRSYSGIQATVQETLSRIIWSDCKLDATVSILQAKVTLRKKDMKYDYFDL